MLIGILADTHDRLPVVEKAVALFREKKVGFAIHAGDFVAPFSLEPMNKLECPWIGVFGNNDGDQKELTRASQGRIQPAPYELNLDGKKVVVVHDLTAFILHKLLTAGAQIIVHAHTHEPKIERRGESVLINPGETCGWLKGKCTVAFVDTKTLEASVEEIKVP
ncbi:MAG TPA: metallophosphoesterase [Myxococcota bacterium]|nr:metallophosphoesterase [Myxococcota bacterium]HRY93939.1 metallophosphoesterase [Myxococcota bacterium]HSA23253.1 metallophosphoesterase [Myxococcota bacterium]